MPVKPEDVAKVKGVLDQVHQNFIDDVVSGRGDRLKGDKTEIFSGDFWSGDQAVKLGLADGAVNLWDAMQQELEHEILSRLHRKAFVAGKLIASLFGSQLNLTFSQLLEKHLAAKV